MTPATTTKTTIDDLHTDVLTRILLRLDGPSLAAASCADTALGSLASDRTLWDRLCLSTFPSLSLRPLLLEPTGLASPRQFFYRAYPFPAPDAAPTPSSSPATHLISAVDLYHRGELLYSGVVDTETQSQWFLSAPFRMDALERNNEDTFSTTTTNPTRPQSLSSSSVISPEDLTLNWVLIDPTTRDAANLSSRRPVAIERHWYTGETQVRFATVLSSGAAAATVTVTLGDGGRSGGVDGDSHHQSHHLDQLLEISLSVENGAEGACLNGKHSLEVLCGAIRGGRESLSVEGEAKAVARYREFDRKKRERKESKAAREGKLDLCCAVLGASLLLSSVAAMAFRW